MRYAEQLKETERLSYMSDEAWEKIQRHHRPRFHLSLAECSSSSYQACLSLLDAFPLRLHGEYILLDILTSRTKKGPT